MRYASRRSIVYAPHGMVATSQHLAAQAGLDILRSGGNAIDAAIAAAMALSVVEPCSNGLGGDAFAIVWYHGKMYGLNSSGKSPALINIEKVWQLGFDSMPEYGFVPVTVPGIPGAWAALNRRFGRLSLSTAAAGAIDYAENGYPVSPVIAQLWKDAAVKYSKIRDWPGIQEWFKTYAPDGTAPEAGQIVKLPFHARSLRRIAESCAEDFYRGGLAQEIGTHFENLGGFLRKSDLQQFEPEWVEPISISYHGRDIWELPPNGQGIVALMALNILKGFVLTDREDARSYHLQLEAIKLAFADAFHYVTDPAYMKVTTAELLSESFAAKRRELITDKASVPSHGIPSRSDTVYLCTADSEGNMVSYIQSNYSGFGSGIVIPNTGIAMQNRGNGFSLDPAHYNCLMPQKKTYHTIIPGFITENGQPVGPFGMMGGFMQPQGHVQMVMNMYNFGLDIQESLDAPRWQWLKDNRIWLEPEAGENILHELQEKGHNIQFCDMSNKYGRGQTIFHAPYGGYMGATEPRADGTAAGW